MEVVIEYCICILEDSCYFSIPSDERIRDQLIHRFVGSVKDRDYFWSPSCCSDSVREKFGERQYVEGELEYVPDELKENLWTLLDLERSG